MSIRLPDILKSSKKLKGLVSLQKVYCFDILNNFRFLTHAEDTHMTVTKDMEILIRLSLSNNEDYAFRLFPELSFETYEFLSLKYHYGVLLLCCVKVVMLELYSLIYFRLLDSMFTFFQHGNLKNS